MTKVNIDLWVLLVGVALPSACLFLISLTYCWRRLSRRRKEKKAIQNEGAIGFNQQVLLEMVLQQTDNALNNIVDAVQQQRLELLKVLETHHLQSHLIKDASPPANETIVTETSPSSATSASQNGASTNPADDHASSMSSATTSNNIKTKATAAIFDPYSQIPEQIQKGLSVGEVASRLNIPESAVDLYVKLRLSAPNSHKQKTA